MTKERHQNLPGRVALKAAVLVSALLCLTWVPYVLLGVWNKRFGGWRSVFYCYAGSPNYIDTYAPGFLTRAFRWFPVPIGILSHNGTHGLVIASPVSEDDFLDPANFAKFQKLQRRIRRIAALMQVEQVNLAGILPGVVHDHGILELRDNRPIVQKAVVAAAEHLVESRFDGNWPAIVLIWGAGHVGAPVADALRARRIETHVVDPRINSEKLPRALHGRRCLVIDISRNGVIKRYIEQMWPGVILLNETFPRPPRAVIAALADVGVETWHLSGLAGSVVPPLPFGYEDAVPCCAAHDVCDSPDVRLIQLASANPKIGVEGSQNANSDIIAARHRNQDAA